MLICWVELIPCLELGIFLILKWGRWCRVSPLLFSWWYWEFLACDGGRCWCAGICWMMAVIHAGWFGCAWLCRFHASFGQVCVRFGLSAPVCAGQFVWNWNYGKFLPSLPIWLLFGMHLCLGHINRCSYSFDVVFVVDIVCWRWRHNTIYACGMFSFFVPEWAIKDLMLKRCHSCVKSSWGL